MTTDDTSNTPGDGHAPSRDAAIDQAIAARTRGDFDEARRRLADLLRAAPDSARLHYQMAWTHDAMGDETGAVPFYERALRLGLDGDDRCGALLGLGSTYRALGRYDRAVATLEQGLREFPDNREFAVFLAMALYNTGQHTRAMSLLLRTIADTSADPSVRRFRRAIAFYADRLDQTWG